ncbi:alpha/beta hydrolase [Planctomycetes bacterium K23_9]
MSPRILAIIAVWVVGGQTCLAQPNPLTTKVAVKCLADLKYSDAEGKAGLCDVYLPKPALVSEEQSPKVTQKRPAVVIVHGGAWMTGDKWTLEGYSRLLASHGIVVVTINYRLAPKHKFPRQVDDVRQALIWTAQHADEFAIDLERLGLFGYSAGGHLSTLVAMLADEPAATQQAASEWKANDPRWNQVPTVHAVCAGGPPCDFRTLPIDNTGMSYFLGGSRREKSDVYTAASPTAHASAGDPPMQIIHGESDFMVPIASSRSLRRKLLNAGCDVRFLALAGQGHMVTFLDPRTRQAALEFFQSVFIKPSLSVWDMRRLGRSPQATWIDQAKPIRELIYKGETVDGVPTDVFAFYATPGSIANDPSLDKNLPCVVLVHGGGGTAFAPWVWKWAKRGYAAIAMDLAGHRPQSPKFDAGELVVDMRAGRKRLENGGPNQGHAEKFSSVGGTLQDDWPFHAIGNVIRAHSLVRSFPEIDADRTAITGISWGGYTTCITASIDDRFKAAVPVYGCGFLHDGESVQRPLIDALPPAQREQWIQQYDPSSHLANCRVPIFFVNGTNDKHYPLPSYSRSFDLVPDQNSIRIAPNMKHSHQAGWEPKEIDSFIDSQLNGDLPLPKLSDAEIQDNALQVAFSSESKLKSARLHLTNDKGLFRERKWLSQAATIEGSKIKATADFANATAWFVTATDERGAMVSTKATCKTAANTDTESQ